MQELQAALEHTPIPHEDVIAKGHRTVWYTWFETFHKHSTLSCLFEASLQYMPQLISQLAAYHLHPLSRAYTQGLLH